MSWSYQPLLSSAQLLAQVSPTVSLGSPADAGSTSDTTPDLTFTGTDTNNDDIRYNVQVSTSSSFGQIAVDSVSNSGDLTSVSSATWSHTTSGSDRIIVVGSNARGVKTDTNTTVTGITYGSRISTPTNLTKGGSTTDATSIPTASVTFTANRLYILTVNSRTGITADPNQPTATGGNVTWTVPTNGSEVIDTTSASRRRLTVLYGICSSTTTGAVTIDFGGQSQESFGWIIDEISSGFDTTTPIVQAAKNNSQTAVTSITATLSAFGASNNATYGAFGCSNGTTNPTAGTGFATVTENTDAGGDGNLGLETEFRVDNDTTVDFSFSSDTELGCIGLEIKAANAIQSLTKIRADNSDGPDPDTYRGRSELWYLIAPATGINYITVTYTGTVTATGCGAISLTGVIQGIEAIDAHNGSTANTDTTPSVDVTVVASGCYLIDTIYSRSDTLAKDASQTTIMAIASNAGGDDSGMTYKASSGTGSQTMAWTSGAEESALSAVSIAPAPILINTVSGTDAGFSGSPDNSDPFASGQAVTYAVQSQTTVDSYSESNKNWQNSLYSGAITEAGQSITGNGRYVDTVEFYLQKVGSPTGNAVAKIYAHTGSFGAGGTPTGAVLATSNNVDVSTLGTSFALTSFTFPTPLFLTNATNYCVVVAYSGGDSSNKVEYGFDDTSPSHGGNLVEYNGSWAGWSSTDVCFYLYSKDDTLLIGTTYYWRVRGIDPSGSNSYGDWSTTRSFSVVTAGVGTILTLQGIINGGGFIPSFR